MTHPKSFDTPVDEGIEPLPRPAKTKRWVALGVSLALIAGVVAGGFFVWEKLVHRFTPERCTVVNPDGDPVTLTKEQSRMSSIIIAASYEAELSEQAAVIALATAYQESDIRNLDHGDRDSLGLFQQRPDPKLGWGTAEQIQDPWYASLRFYEELVKFKGWETADVNDQAQKVQRSGHPEAYRKHEGKARALAAAGRGSSQSVVTCVDLDDPVANPEPIAEVLGRVPGATVTVDGDTIRISAPDDQRLWSAVHLAMLNSYDAGITKVRAGDRSWKRNDSQWTSADPIDGAIITLG